MKNLDLTKQTVGSLSKLIKRKEISPIEITKATLERISILDGSLKAFTTVMESDAIRAAKEAERAILSGTYLGPYHGIPVAIKDLYYTKGVRTTAGSKVLSDFIPDYDATLVARLKDAGAVIVGKTNTHEFAYGYVTSPTRNPWDTERIPGGSSGGSGVAVATSMCAAATGTDTAGSIRVPSSMNGVVGLKPTFGRVSKYGVVVLSWSLDHMGPITKNVEDLALMMNIIAGYDPQDDSSVDLPVPDYTMALSGNISGIKLGIPKEHFLEPLEPDVSAAFQKAVNVFKNLGATIQEVSLPTVSLSSVAALFNILMSEASTYHEEWFKTKADLYSPEVYGLLQLGNLIPAVDYIKAQRLRKLICDDFELAFKRIDALIMPTLPITAPKASESIVNVGASTGSVTDLCGRNMLPLTAAGLPAISVPCGFSDNRLPIGLQIVGRPFDESGVIKIAHCYEKETNWQLRHPLP